MEGQLESCIGAGKQVASRGTTLPERTGLCHQTFTLRGAGGVRKAAVAQGDDRKTRKNGPASGLLLGLSGGWVSDKDPGMKLPSYLAAIGTAAFLLIVNPCVTHALDDPTLPGKDKVTDPGKKDDDKDGKKKQHHKKGKADDKPEDPKKPEDPAK
jgi:hypothetical protein